ncbi:MAG: hypothetical protein A2Y40_02070 [Candidatus Margulisbacteria bacterium GWF2_35_9]|nr:MAG: hypothetical protein A2Y40_02070 [Candidatus Margulisbacteria bacterium GWF2_35_9]
MTTTEEHIYKKNIASFKSLNSEIAKIINSGEMDNNLILVKTTSDNAGLVYKKDDQEINITSSIDPYSFAKEIIDQEYLENKEAIEKKSIGMVLTLDPYMINYMLEKYNWYKHMYFVFPSKNYLFTLLHYFDFSEIIKKYPYFNPLVAENHQELERNIVLNLEASDYVYQGLKYFVYYPYNKVALETIELILKIIRDATLFKQSNVQTSMMYGGMILQNEIRCIDKFIEYPDIGILKDLVKGKPVVCVAAGPSLVDDLDFLKKIQNDVCIIAVASVLKPLLEKGIRPDFVTILDMKKEVRYYLENIEIGDIPVVIEANCHYSVMDNIKANFIISPSAIRNRKYLVEFLDLFKIVIPSDALIQGAMTVAFMSIQLAFRMGATKIILLGQDLSYEEKTHVDGCRFDHEVSIFTENGKHFYRYKLFDGEEERLEPCFFVKGIHKEQVPVNIAFDSYRRYLERMIVANDLAVVNCTRRGVFIDHTEHINLEEAYSKYIKEYCLDNKNFNLPIRREYDYTELPKILQTLEDNIKLYDEIKAVADQGLKAFENLQKEEKKKKMNQKLVDKYTQTINKNLEELSAKYNHQVSFIAQQIQGGYYLFKYLENVVGKEYSNKDRQVDMRNKGVLFFGSISDGMTFFSSEINDMINRISKKYIKG